MQDEPTNLEQPEIPVSAKRKWAKRAGIGAFMFFFIKGLVWLGVAVVGAYYAFF